MECQKRALCAPVGNDWRTSDGLAKFLKVNSTALHLWNLNKTAIEMATMQRKGNQHFVQRINFTSPPLRRIWYTTKTRRIFASEISKQDPSGQRDVFAITHPLGRTGVIYCAAIEALQRVKVKWKNSATADSFGAVK